MREEHPPWSANEEYSANLSHEGGGESVRRRGGTRTVCRSGLETDGDEAARTMNQWWCVVDGPELVKPRSPAVVGESSSASRACACVWSTTRRRAAALEAIDSHETAEACGSFGSAAPVAPCRFWFRGLQASWPGNRSPAGERAYARLETFFRLRAYVTLGASRCQGEGSGGTCWRFASR